jgi:hypothetical protein
MFVENEQRRAFIIIPKAHLFLKIFETHIFLPHSTTMGYAIQILTFTVIFRYQASSVLIKEPHFFATCC